MLLDENLAGSGRAAPLDDPASVLPRHPLVCLSHLRWDLVWQRPQHLMTRFARVMPVFFVEEPAFEGDDPPHLAEFRIDPNLTVLVPHFPTGTLYAATAPDQAKLLNQFFSARGLAAPVLWFYTPEALSYGRALSAAVTVYDCMDELSGFRDASPELPRREAELLDRADIVFTGGLSLYEAKRALHRNVHAMPSAVDAEHFGQARLRLPDPPDQASIARPRLGFFGVIDERLDRDLVAAVAGLRPDWQIIILGPVVKIAPESLPRAPNIHYLGRKPYDELPAYVGNWDVAIMPFARNAATRFISPTKTPEFLAGGRPVISTPIVDVVRSWGGLDAVRIAATPAEFVRETEIALSLPGGAPDWLAPVDAALAQISWDRTWSRMAQLIATQLAEREAASPAGAPGAGSISESRFEYLDRA